MKFNIHEWINSAGVALAVIVAAYSAYFAREATLPKKEEVSISAIPTGDCRVEFAPVGDAAELGLCWLLTVSNKSEIRLSLVDARVFSIRGGAIAFAGGGRFHAVEAISGQPEEFPLTLDSGESLRLIARMPARVPNSVYTVLKKVISDGGNHPISMAHLQNILAADKLSLLGDEVEPMQVDSEIKGWSMKSPFQSAEGYINFMSGRGEIFVGSLTWPPRI